jgi:hypothetical protein
MDITSKVKKGPKNNAPASKKLQLYQRHCQTNLTSHWLVPNFIASPFA